MNIVAIIGRNARALKEAEMRRKGGELTSLDKISAKTQENGHRVPPTTVGRILEGVRSTQVEDVAAVAIAFGVEPWQLLVPTFQAHNHPALRTVGEDEDHLYARLRQAAHAIIQAEDSTSASDKAS